MFTVFGGTGKVGSKLVKQLLAQGRDVRLIQRTPSSAIKMFGQPSNLEVVQGDYLRMSIGEIQQAVQGSQSVALCQAASRFTKFSDLWTWTPKGNHPANYPDFVRKVATQCATQEIKLVYLSVWGVENPFNWKIAMINTITSNSTKYHLEEEQIIRSTPGLNYVVVRPTKFDTFGLPKDKVEDMFQNGKPDPSVIRVSQAADRGRIMTNSPSGTMNSVHNIGYVLKEAMENEGLSKTTFHMWDQDAKRNPATPLQGSDPNGWTQLKPDSERHELPSNKHSVASWIYGLGATIFTAAIPILAIILLL